MLRSKANPTMLVLGARAGLTRWAAGLAGCVLAALCITAVRLGLGIGVAGLLVAGIAGCVGLWLAWLALRRAFTPRTVAHVKQRVQVPDASDSLAPAFVDTQAIWMASEQETAHVMGLAVEIRQDSRLDQMLAARGRRLPTVASP